jgi:hypothetical protein
MSAFGGKADIGWRTLLLHLCAAAVTAKTLPSAALAFHRVALPRAIAAPALVREVQPLRAGASANQPSFPAYARALINWLPSNPISNAFFSIHAFALGAWVSIPASANACNSRIASARSIFDAKDYSFGCYPMALKNASVNVPRQNFGTIYVAATSDEFDDGISKFAFDFASLNRFVRLNVQNRGHASVFADLIGNPRFVY